jgi:two-component system chemotaxis response regulator CheY
MYPDTVRNETMAKEAPMGKTILVVDDSEFALQMTAFMLRNAGCEVKTAQSGLEALEILAEGNIDAVIVDINMPVMDGYTLTRKIRADEAFGAIPIIMITTESEAKDMEKGFEAGANAYLVKPVTPQQVISQITMLTGG